MSAADVTGERNEAADVPVGEMRRSRAKTISRREMTREAKRRRRRGETEEVLDYERPQFRSQCLNGRRPCLFVSCRYNLYLDVNPETGSIKFNFPDKEPWELEESCALDVAERGGITLEETGIILNLTRERIRQVEAGGLTNLKGAAREQQLAPS